MHGMESTVRCPKAHSFAHFLVYQIYSIRTDCCLNLAWPEW